MFNRLLIKRLLSTSNTLQHNTTVNTTSAPLPSSMKQYKRAGSSRDRQFRRVGIPFLLFMVIGSFGMSKMISGKFELENERNNDARLMQELNGEDAVTIAEQSLIHKSRKVKRLDLVNELNTMRNKLDWNDDYDIVRVPRTQTAEQAEQEYRDRLKQAQQNKPLRPRITGTD